MMPAMSKANLRPVVLGSAVCALALAACAGGAKQADSPGTCPEGTVLRGEDCVPPEAAGDESTPSKRAKKDDDDFTSSSASSQASSDDKPSSSSSSSAGSASSPSSGSAGGKTPYDKDAVEVQLKRAARQVKANCGSATDTDGKATGPWGSTKASVVLGRNGRIKQVSVPSPYDGRPVGDCVVHAFEKLVFPPYAGSSDVSVDWDIEITPPKHR
jgi:hypothetical protein